DDPPACAIVPGWRQSRLPSGRAGYSRFVVLMGTACAGALIWIGSFQLLNRVVSVAPLKAVTLAATGSGAPRARTYSHALSRGAPDLVPRTTSTCCPSIRPGRIGG